MSSVIAHVYYLAVLGVQHNRSKASHLHCGELFCIPGRKIVTVKLLIIYIGRYALFWATHTSHLHNSRQLEY